MKSHNLKLKRLAARPEAWTITLLLLASAPSFFVLKPWTFLLLGALLTWRGLAPPFLKRKRWQHIFLISCLIAAIAGAFFSYPTLWGGDSILTILILTLTIKWVEAKTSREHNLIVLGAVITAAIGSLYGDGVFQLVHLFLVVLISLAAFRVISNSGPNAYALRQSISVALRHMAMAFPITVLLFMFFPRIPGPIWDLGLVFGLPIQFSVENTDQSLGFGLTLQAQDIPKMSASNDAVLVAQFHDYTPYKSELYWRGPVFWDFDGRSWHLPSHWDKRSNLMRHAIRDKNTLEKRLVREGDEIAYSIRVMPHGQRWLYALDVPTRGGPEAFISNDFQLLSIRKVTEERQFDLTSQLAFALDRSLTEEQRQRAKAVPSSGNPKIIDLAETTRESLGGADATAQQVSLALATHLSEGDYEMSEAARLPEDVNRLDHLFFQQRSGGAEPFATASVMFFRAAGVPARLVSGYHRGTIIALTDFLVVKQADAHAWVEFWDEAGGGWRRFDPKDFVANVTAGAPKTRSAANPVPQAVKEELEQERTPPPSNDPPPQAEQNSSLWAEIGSWFDSLQLGLDKWVIDYNPDRQVELFDDLGMPDFKWLGMLTTMAAVVICFFGLYFVYGAISTRPRPDPVVKAYKRFLDLLARAHVDKRPEECPRTFQRRACETAPDLAVWITDILDRYISLRYGPSVRKGEVRAFQRQVKRFAGLM
ncbi:MAG: DUF3488 and transglutaminase-like domain-containing protein [Pseudomonadota bacterium]